MAKLFFLFATINGALVVILGAFGAHALKGKISDTLLSTYQVSTYYHMFHVLALMCLSLLLSRLSAVPSSLIPSILLFTGYLWIVGIVLFSGSLYGLSVGGPSWLGPITPIGGLLLIAGWVCFSIGVMKIPL